jgi:hypothetical protein
MVDALDALRRAEGDLATVFDSPSEAVEMARTTRSYARQVGATDVWMARSGRFIWTRMQCLNEFKDILFQATGSVL